MPGIVADTDADEEGMPKVAIALVSLDLLDVLMLTEAIGTFLHLDGGEILVGSAMMNDDVGVGGTRVGIGGIGHARHMAGALAGARPAIVFAIDIPIGKRLLQVHGQAEGERTLRRRRLEQRGVARSVSRAWFSFS